MALLKYLLVVISLVGFYVAAFLRYPAWDFAEWIIYITWACALAVVFFSISALFRRRWKELAIFSATLVIAFLPAFGVGWHLEWLLGEGFRLHASPVEQYLSQCKLVEFVENGIKQTAGQCESHGIYSGYARTVIYDTTGELLKPVSQRTPEWRHAMDEFYSEEVLASSEDRTRHIFGDFYEVGNSLAEERG